MKMFLRCVYAVRIEYNKIDGDVCSFHHFGPYLQCVQSSLGQRWLDFL